MSESVTLHSNSVYDRYRIDALSDVIQAFDGQQFPQVDQYSNLQDLVNVYNISTDLDSPAYAEYLLLQTGQTWEVEAEATMVDNSRTIIFSGRVNRRLSEAERTYLDKKYEDANVRTEFEMVQLIAKTRDGFTSLEKDEEIPYGYQVAPGNLFIHNQPGQLKKIGQNDGRDVLVLRIDAETYLNADKKPASRYQPDSVAQLTFISDVLRHYMDTDSTIALVSTTDYPSTRYVVDRASMKRDRKFAVALAGRNTLRAVADKFLPEAGIVDYLDELANIRQQLVDLVSETERA